MPALYEITADIQAIMLRMEAAEGELTPELAEALDGLQVAFEEKVENVLRYRAGQEAAAKGIDDEVKRLTALRNSYLRRAESIEKYLFRSMQTLGIPKVVGKLFQVWLQKNAMPTLTPIRGDDGKPIIPEKYRRTYTDFVYEWAYDDYKAGVPLPPEITVKQGVHLRIR